MKNTKQQDAQQEAEELLKEGYSEPYIAAYLIPSYKASIGTKGINAALEAAKKKILL